MPNLLIKELQNQDQQYFKEALDLLNRTQGRDLFEETYLEQKVNHPNAKVFGAFLDSNIIGIGVAEIITDFVFYKPFDSEICNELKTKKVGSFSTLAILETLQGKGIGQKISHARLKWLTDQGCNVILGLSWVSGLAHTSNRVFEKMGFKPVKRIDDFFKEMSIKKPFECPGCMNVPCTCAGIFYRLNL
jgi:GNAT superfamily N-acetyltransferase